MRKIILSTAIVGSLLFATPTHGETPDGTRVVIDTPQKTIVINMINLEKPRNSDENFRFQQCGE